MIKFLYDIAMTNFRCQFKSHFPKMRKPNYKFQRQAILQILPSLSKKLECCKDYNKTQNMRHHILKIVYL